MTLPENMIDRWAQRHDPQPGEKTLYWHVLMAGYPEVGDLAGQAAGRLAPFSGLHLTPADRLHMTTLLVGSAEHITSQQLQQMTQTAARCLDSTRPIPVRVGKILYHAQAIMLAVTPAAALAPIRAAATAATKRAGICPADRDGWTPHITLCYSTAYQPARPIIDALGTNLPERQLSITSLSLVIQNGSERAWDWTIAGTVPLTASTRAAMTT